MDRIDSMDIAILFIVLTRQTDAVVAPAWFILNATSEESHGEQQIPRAS
jgi:hypothetical protein